MTYLELDQVSNGLVQIIREMGVNKGDRVVLFLPKSLSTVIAHLAIQKIGAVSVPLNPDYKHTEIQYLIRDVEATLVIVGLKQEKVLREIDSN